MSKVSSPLGEATSHSTKLQETAAKSLVIPNPLPLAGEGTNEKNIFIDEHSGKGGSYVRDADGKRVLQERTDHAATNDAGAIHESPAATGKTAPAKNKSTNVKGANNA